MPKESAVVDQMLAERRAAQAWSARRRRLKGATTSGHMQLAGSTVVYITMEWLAASGRKRVISLNRRVKLKTHIVNARIVLPLLVNHNAETTRSVTYLRRASQAGFRQPRSASFTR